jgi:hypothetical protein
MEEIVRLIRYDNDVRYKTESYRKMASVLGKEKADEEVKRKMVPACSIGVLFDGNGRNAANILGFTGLALCDIDSLVNEELRMKNEEYATAIETVRQKINADPHTLLCYVTIGGNGFRIIYRYTREAEEDSLSTPLSPRRGAGGEAFPSRFLLNFPHHCLFESFAWIDESTDEIECSLGWFLTSTCHEHLTFLVLDDGDDCRCCIEIVGEATRFAVLRLEIVHHELFRTTFGAIIPLFQVMHTFVVIYLLKTFSIAKIQKNTLTRVCKTLFYCNLRKIKTF